MFVVNVRTYLNIIIPVAYRYMGTRGKHRKAIFQFPLHTGCFLRAVSGVITGICSDTRGTLIGFENEKRVHTYAYCVPVFTVYGFKSRKADAGLPNTYAGANNNVMRGHDPCVYTTAGSHVIYFILTRNLLLLPPRSVSHAYPSLRREFVRSRYLYKSLL